MFAIKYHEKSCKISSNEVKLVPRQVFTKSYVFDCHFATLSTQRRTVNGEITIEN